MDASTTADIELLTDHPPAPGDAVEVAPGLLWARLPLPMRLNHVNLWFTREGDGWLVVDAGLDSAMCRDAWEKLLAGPLAKLPIRRIALTHGHPDHVGLAGWLTERFDCTLAATRTEWLFAIWRREHQGRSFGRAIERFFTSNGCDAQTLQQFADQEASIERSRTSIPEQFLRLRHGDTVRFGHGEVRVIIGSGHADEHASFYREDGHVLIAGDQILQRITPVIGVFGNEPESDPLSAYLASMPRFADLPADTLVLPSHGLPFRGLSTRIAQLRHHHQERLGQIVACLDIPRSGYEVTRRIFERAVQEGQGRFAFAETMAHLRYGETIGVLERTPASDGSTLFQRI